MAEAQPGGMEELATHERRPTAVGGVAGDGVAEPGEVHPDLVGAARGRPRFDQRPAAEALQCPVECARLAATGHHGHPLSVRWVAPDRADDLALGRLWITLD